ncbi:carbohydrate ABC transporter permease [Saliphagus infecundisoli]|uniref:Carbohydrate ABC transporter permease n=1 Tax=Saliphagus infecundisoli TaxID=1849069 RepID=A0ABD5QB19_9EURY|nr:carbohydrate ABC transporter permease [Saliphagus infecundisoli]
MSTASRRAQLSVSDILYKLLFYSTLGMFLLMVLVPLILVISASFRPLVEIYATDVYLIPKEPTIQPWIDGYEDLKPNLLNSLYIATGTVTIALVVAIPGAYAYARTSFPWKKPLFYIIILSLLFPHVLLVIPITDLWYDFGLYNTLPGVWLGHQTFVVPFAIWIMRDFFQKMPSNLEEAAQIYGCTQWSAFVRVVLPLAKPAIIAVLFLAFLNGWNDFLFANMVTDSRGPQPAVVQLYQTINGGSGEATDWQLLMSESLIIGLPPVTLYLFARRYISEAFAVSAS